MEVIKDVEFVNNFEGFFKRNSLRLSKWPSLIHGDKKRFIWTSTQTWLDMTTTVLVPTSIMCGGGRGKEEYDPPGILFIFVEFTRLISPSIPMSRQIEFIEEILTRIMCGGEKKREDYGPLQKIVNTNTNISPSVINRILQVMQLL
jgi:hypothetical protein